MEENGLILKENAALAASLQRAEGLLRGMAEMLRETNERMSALETQVRMLEKVTPAQATEICRAIRKQAAELCGEYRLPKAAEKPIAEAIRKTVRTYTGSRSMREIARCDYQAILRMAEEWDDYSAIQKIKGAMKEGEEKHGDL